MDIKDEDSVASPSRGTSHGRSHSGTKRRAAAGSRGVAHLTPDQLAKKRANDREAQRAIRERTKGQIETLERRIQELTSQQPYQDLQHVVRQKELVEAENEDIKQRLRSVLNIIQPLVDGNVLNGTLNRLLSSQISNTSSFTLLIDYSNRTCTTPLPRLGYNSQLQSSQRGAAYSNHSRPQ